MSALVNPTPTHSRSSGVKISQFVVIGFAAMILALMLGLITVLIAQESQPASAPAAKLARRASVLKWVSEGDPLDSLSIQGVSFEAHDPVVLYFSPAYDASVPQFIKLTDTTADEDGRFVAQIDLSQRTDLRAGGYIVAYGKISGYTSPPLGPLQRTSHLASPATPVPPTPVAPTPTPVPPLPLPEMDPIDRWYSEYFANRDLLDSPVITRNDTAINFAWGQGQPNPYLPRDNFSVRWTRRAMFPDTESYRFTLTVDDGARVYLDDQLIINEWRIGPRRTFRQSAPVTRGEHRLRVEYYSATGSASISLDWKSGYSAWEGRYYNSTDFSGDVVLKRDDGDVEGGIHLDWASNAPAPGVSPDNFSTVWERSVVFPQTGEYTFNIEVDDGARIYIDGTPLYDNLNAVGAFEAKRTLARGRHFVQVQYVERGGDARFKLDWAPVEPAP